MDGEMAKCILRQAGWQMEGSYPAAAGSGRENVIDVFTNTD